MCLQHSLTAIVATTFQIPIMRPATDAPLRALHSYYAMRKERDYETQNKRA